MKNTVILMILGILLGSCSEEKDRCPEGSCLPNGSCTMVDGQPVCTCEAPDEPCENLTCCYKGKQSGEACEKNEDCPLGFCHEPLFAEAYCSNFCQTQNDCENHAEGDNSQMCCVELDVDTSTCVKIAEGYACGDGSGTCGTSCTGALDSACDVDHICLGISDTDPVSICSKTCETYHDCTGCLFEGAPNVPAQCLMIAGGQGYCLFAGLGCISSMDCPEGETCAIAINADRTILFGECINAGALAPGSACNNEDDPNDLPFENRCSGFYCLGGKCSELCEADIDCPEVMSCLEYSFSGVDDSIMVCKGN